VVAELETHVVGARLKQRLVLRAWPRDHHVIDRSGKLGEEVVQCCGVGRVQRGRRARAELVTRVREAIGAAGDEDDVGALAARTAGRLETNAGAAADNDDRLSQKPGRPCDGWGAGGGRHAAAPVLEG
jgi:hypothetical protein